MSNIIEYKGYQAKIEYSSEDNCFFGKVQDIDDMLIFEIENASEALVVFKNAIDEYLDMCSEIGKEPEKAYKGCFNVRVSPKLHKKAVQKARLNNISLNDYVERAIEAYIGSDSSKTVYNIHVHNDNNDKREFSECAITQYWKNSLYGTPNIVLQKSKFPLC